MSIPVVLNWGDSDPQGDVQQYLETFFGCHRLGKWCIGTSMSWGQRCCLISCNAQDSTHNTDFPVPNDNGVEVETPCSMVPWNLPMKRYLWISESERGFRMGTPPRPIMSAGKECRSRGERIQKYETETAFEGSGVCLWQRRNGREIILGEKKDNPYSMTGRKGKRIAGTYWEILMGKRCIVRVPIWWLWIGRSRAPWGWGSKRGEPRISGRKVQLC